MTSSCVGPLCHPWAYSCIWTSHLTFPRRDDCDCSQRTRDHLSTILSNELSGNVPVPARRCGRAGGWSGDGELLS